MERPPTSRLRLFRATALLQFTLSSLVVLLCVANLHKFYSIGIFLRMDYPDAARCPGPHGVKDGFADRVEAVLSQVEALREKLEITTLRIDRDRELRAQNMSRSEFRRFLDEEVIQSLGSARSRLQLIRLAVPRVEKRSGDMEDPLVDFFSAEEARRYLTSRENRRGELSIHGALRSRGTIGHACVVMKEDLEEYMSYDVGSHCKDDWALGQRLMLGGCDPLPRRRCLVRAPRLRRRPHPLDGEERLRWVASSKWSNASGSHSADFLIRDVLALKPDGEIRIGLDVSVGNGTFAARMREWDVTIVSMALNAGAPFSETIALRGFVPLYATLNQRLPFFDNTMDLIHTADLLDGRVDLHLLDLVLFDWDRVLRPGGLLWIDRFRCDSKRLEDYSFMFLQFRYRKHKWVVSPSSGDEVYLSALLEKPARGL